MICKSLFLLPLLLISANHFNFVVAVKGRGIPITAIESYAYCTVLALIMCPVKVECSDSDSLIASIKMRIITEGLRKHILAGESSADTSDILTHKCPWVKISDLYKLGFTRFEVADIARDFMFLSEYLSEFYVMDIGGLFSALIKGEKTFLDSYLSMLKVIRYPEGKFSPLSEIP
jgi:hypothetical protein